MARRMERIGSLNYEWLDPTMDEIAEELENIKMSPTVAVRRLLEARKRLDAVRRQLHEESLSRMYGKKALSFEDVAENLFPEPLCGIFSGRGNRSDGREIPGLWDRVSVSGKAEK